MSAISFSAKRYANAGAVGNRSSANIGGWSHGKSRLPMSDPILLRGAITLDISQAL